jgi:hypothetical protein
MKTNFVRMMAAMLLLAVAVLSLPSAVHADGATLGVDIVSVKPGVSVTIRANNFPGGLFTVRMDKAGGQAANGTQVDVTNTGNGGSFQETYKIPAALKNETRLTIRLEKGSTYGYNSFDNKTSSAATPTPVATVKPSGGTKASIAIIGVDKNVAAVVRAEDFPANVNFTVRVGPYYSFFRDFVTTGTINSGKGGTFDFKVQLPSVVKDVELVTVRLDGGGVFAYNAFRNVTGGSTGSITSTPTVAPTYACKVTLVSPTAAVKKGEDFDAAWELKNTSSVNWEMNGVDLKFVSGANLHEKSIYDMKKTVKPGETIKVIVDMRAPSSTGTYKESWALVQSGKTLCAMDVSMTVK